MAVTKTTPKLTPKVLAGIFPVAGAPGATMEAVLATTITEDVLVKLVEQGFVTDVDGIFNLAAKAARKVAAKPAKAEGTIERAKSTVSKDGTQVCKGTGEKLPVTSFPTVWYKGEVKRGEYSRTYLKAQRAAGIKPAPKAKATKAPAKPKAPAKAPAKAKTPAKATAASKAKAAAAKLAEAPAAG